MEIDHIMKRLEMDDKIKLKIGDRVLINLAWKHGPNSSRKIFYHLKESRGIILNINSEQSIYYIDVENNLGKYSFLKEEIKLDMEYYRDQKLKEILK